MLQAVTFTGADDKTNPADLIEFSMRYPFVEWGILIGTRQGVARMPSQAWINHLLALRQRVRYEVNLALHVCGLQLRTIADGRSIVGDGGESIRAFDRVQLNWHGERQETIGANIARSFCAMRDSIGWLPEVIFQGDEVNAAAGLHVLTEREDFQVSMLFDCSHGAGVLPAEWPKSNPSIKCGWAGGLGPDNFLTQLERIHAAYVEGGSRFPFYWVDMESMVRSGELGNDWFDLAKCQEVAEAAKTRVWIEEAP